MPDLSHWCHTQAAGGKKKVLAAPPGVSLGGIKTGPLRTPGVAKAKKDPAPQKTIETKNSHFEKLLGVMLLLCFAPVLSCCGIYHLKTVLS
jgi:hypothetical protein